MPPNPALPKLKEGAAADEAPNTRPSPLAAAAGAALEGLGCPDAPACLVALRWPSSDGHPSKVMISGRGHHGT